MPLILGKQSASRSYSYENPSDEITRQIKRLGERSDDLATATKKFNDEIYEQLLGELNKEKDTPVVASAISDLEELKSELNSLFTDATSHIMSAKTMMGNFKIAYEGKISDWSKKIKEARNIQ